MNRRHHPLAAVVAAVVVAVVAASVAAGACGGSRRGGGAKLPPAEVEFANQSLNQADVFAVSRSGGRTRIGTVMAGRTEVLTVQAGTIGADGAVSVVARIRASSRVVSTGLIALAPGERLRVTLPLDERVLVALPGREP